jgi:hypothetical protein
MIYLSHFVLIHVLYFSADFNTIACQFKVNRLPWLQETILAHT